MEIHQSLHFSRRGRHAASIEAHRVIRGFERLFKPTQAVEHLGQAAKGEIIPRVLFHRLRISEQGFFKLAGLIAVVTCIHPPHIELSRCLVSLYRYVHRFLPLAWLLLSYCKQSMFQVRSCCSVLFRKRVCHVDLHVWYGSKPCALAPQDGGASYKWTRIHAVLDDGVLVVITVQLLHTAGRPARDPPPTRK